MKTITNRVYQYKNCEYSILISSDVEPECKEDPHGCPRGNFPFGVFVVVNDVMVFNEGCWTLKEVEKAKRKGIKDAKKFIRLIR